MKNKHIYFILLINLFLLSSCENNNSQPKDYNSQQRSIAFKKIAANIKTINDILNDNKPYYSEEFKKISNELFENSKTPFEYFINNPQGKNGKAKPQIWININQFNQEKNNFLNAVNDFNQKSQTANLNQIKISFSKVENSCKSCHSQFRQ